jgi:hypothetical protein
LPGFYRPVFYWLAFWQADGAQFVGIAVSSIAPKDCICCTSRSATLINNNQALLGNAGQVVIEGCAVDDIFRRLNQIRRFINDAGRVSRACADDFFRFSCP